MATHHNTNRAHATKSSQPSMLKIFAPLFALLLLVVGGLYVIKATLPPINHALKTNDQIRENELAGLILTQLDGKSIKISELNGEVFLLNFWATWCEACIEEMPSIVQLRESYKAQGFEVLGINVDENPGTVVPRTAKQLKMDFPIFIDPEGKLAEMFGVHAIPLTVIIRKKGEVLTVVDGGRDWNSDEMRAKLERWLNG